MTHPFKANFSRFRQVLFTSTQVSSQWIIWVVSVTSVFQRHHPHSIKPTSPVIVQSDFCFNHSWHIHHYTHTARNPHSFIHLHMMYLCLSWHRLYITKQLDKCKSWIFDTHSLPKIYQHTIKGLDIPKLTVGSTLWGYIMRSGKDLNVLFIL